MAVTKYEPAPPGARPKTNVPGAGAPSVFNPILPPTADTPVVDVASDFELPTYDWSNVTLGGGGGGGAPASYYDALGTARGLEAQTASDKLDLEIAKYNQQQALDAAALQRKGLGAQEALKYYQAQLGGVEGGQIPTALGTTLDEQKAAREDFANQTYGNLLSRLGSRYTEAGNLTNEGFAALKSYLEGAPQNAYATAPRAVATPVSNDIAQYMQAQGVDAARVQPGLLAAQAAAQGGAANYNNLLTTLAATSTQANQSRLNEQAMAQRLAQATLTAQKAAQEGALDQAKIAQLNAIQEQYTASRLQLQRDSIARENALRDAIAELGISGNLAIDTTIPEEPAATDTTTTTPAVTQSNAIATLAKQVAAAKGKNAPVLQARANAFIAANPTATPAQVKAEFPQLRAAAVKAIAKKK